MSNFEEYIQTPIEFEKEILAFFGRQDKLVIFDIGACEGEDAIRYSKLFPNATIFAFEPLPNNFSSILKNLSNYRISNVVTLPEALSNTIGKAGFYVSSGHPDHIEKSDDWDYGNKSSSLLAPDKVKETHGWLKFENMIEVKTNTIESFCRSKNIKGIDFIHLDVQGSELMVIEGAGEMLKNIKMIWLEVESVSLYKDQPLKDDVERFMSKNNFLNILDKVSSISGDQLYINKTHFPDYVSGKNNNRFSIGGSLKKLVKQQLSGLTVPLKKPQATNRYQKTSYAQSGEDLIVKYIFDGIGVARPGYLDVGAHHPYYLSNTALFYESGSRGINIEPDPTLFAAFPVTRPGDVNLNVGIGKESGVLDFYVISSPTLNTFSREEAERYREQGDYRIVRVDKVQVTTIAAVISQYAGGKFPDFLSIDAEGVDELILHSIDYRQNAPTVICVETISFSTTGNGVKNTRLIDFLKEKDYLVYADTNINTIFVQRSKWVK